MPFLFRNGTVAPTWDRIDRVLIVDWSPGLAETSVTRFDRHGRIVIPASYRRALGLDEGDEVTLILEDGSVRLITRAEAMRRAQEYVSRLTGDDERSLAEELIAERRAEAASE